MDLRQLGTVSGIVPHRNPNDIMIDSPLSKAHAEIGKLCLGAGCVEGLHCAGLVRTRTGQKLAGGGDIITTYPLGFESTRFGIGTMGTI